MEKSQRFKDKQLKQQQVKPTDRNANSPTKTTTKTKEQDVKIENNENIVRYDNYKKFEYYDGTNASSEHFKELFCDFPVSYETTQVITAVKSLPYVDPPAPTPPPISQLPKRENRLQQLVDTNVSLSAPATPSRGKVVLSRKERKELNKLHKLLDRADTTSSSINLGNLEATELLNAHAESNTYRGRVSELRNCIAKINSRVLFSSLNRSSQKSLTTNSEEFLNVNSETCPPPPAPTLDMSPPHSSNFNNNEENYSEKLRNLPVRQRKAHTSHMENYCLFDPVDFINEKKLRNRATTSCTQQGTNLRDPLFSSRQNLEFLDEDIVPEIIYDNEAPANYEHHNYFVIDPEDFEKEPAIGLPNKHSNENCCKVEISQEDDIIQVSRSCENIIQRESEVNLISKSISQETRNETNCAAPDLLESSSSAASALTSSSTSANSLQTTLQRTKKKLSFLSLSPFRSQSPKSAQACENKKVLDTSVDHKSVERAVSELVSCDHMLHLQQMLQNSKENMRSRTVPIESNYVLFNPGPVPSRNVPYKVRKQRPLSTNSDADSGFLSPCSPDEMSSLKSNPAILVLQQCDSVQGYLEVS